MIPLFIGGTGRSGTTILLQYLNENPLVYASSPIELRILTEQYGLLDLYKSLDLESFLFYLEDHWLNPTDKTEGIYSKIEKNEFNIILNELKNNILNNKRDAIFNFYSKLIFKQKEFKNSSLYYGDSTPSNIKKAEGIFEIFTDCKFINMIRDGRDAAYSIFQMKDFWALEKRNNELDALDWWYTRTVESFNALSKIPDNYYINARLESFVSKKEEKDKILKFLSLYENDSMFTFFNKNINFNKVSTGKWKSLEIASKIDKKYNFMLKKLNDQGIQIEKYY
jgi:hypothetical protein